METKRQRIGKEVAYLKNERLSFDSHWRELGEHFAPRRIRFFDQDRNRGEKRNQKIINSHGVLALRTLRSGMMAGITSPARPWRRLTTPDPDLAEYGPVKEWLHTVNKRMTTIDLRSNLYNVLPTLYGDCGLFGTGACMMVDDPDDLIRFYSFPVGSYWLACDHRGLPNVCVREFQMTVRQLVMAFGDKTASESRKWDNFSRQVRDAWDNGRYEEAISVVSFIGPNTEWSPQKLESKYKRFYSCYYEAGMYAANGLISSADAEDTFLSEKGFDLFPVLAPRWDVTGEDTYGTSCPGMEALPDVKELQMLMRKKKRGLEKQIDPPLTGPVALRTQKTSLMAGDITYLDVRDGQQGLRPIHETSLALHDLIADIQETQRRISRAFYEDLFLMMAQSDRRHITAREIDERHEEKLLALGQVLERMNDELLDPLTDLEFDRMVKAGLVPPPPKELQGVDLRVEYISVMAQAQKLVGVAGLERFIGFVGNMAAAYPQVLDKINADNVVDEYGDRMGVASKIIEDDETVALTRQARAQAQETAAKAQSVPLVADAAKTLSETDMSTDNALTRVLAGA